MDGMSTTLYRLALLMLLKSKLTTHMVGKLCRARIHLDSLSLSPKWLSLLAWSAPARLTTHVNKVGTGDGHLVRMRTSGPYDVHVHQASDFAHVSVTGPSVIGSMALVPVNL